MTKKPNLIVCMADQLRWSELGCYGHPTIRTPHLDAMAAGGVRFDTAVSNAPVCMPARSVVLAGQYARTCCGTLTNANWPGGASYRDAGFPQWPTGARKHLPDPTLPETLREAGYATHAIGKWHIEAWPDAVGFDHYCIPAHHHAHSAQWFIEDGGQPFSPPGFSVDYEADRVCELIAQQSDADAPFFLYYNISPPHMPLADAPEKYLNMYSRDDVVSRLNIPDGYQPDPEYMLTYLWDYRHYRDHLPFTRELPDGCDLIELTRLYMGLTTWVDDCVGRMMAALAEAGLADDTLVIFTADHGDNLGSHGRMGKGHLQEESIRVPMIAAGGPGVISPGTVSRRVSSLVDLAPTLLTSAGLRVPDHMPGRSLGDALADEDSLNDNFALIEACGEGYGIRTATHLLGFRAKSPWHEIAEQPHAFYDLRDDPYEQNNLIGTAEQRDVAEALAARVRRHHAETPWFDRNSQ
jgi:choline-sulfatase